MSKRSILILAILLTLAGCIGRSDRRPRGAKNPPRQTVVVRGNDPVVLKQCLGKLDRLVARYALLPDRTFGGSCDALGSVQLRDIGTPTTNLGAMTCGLANAFVTWVQNDLQGPAQEYLHGRVVKIETMGTYSCRNVNGAATGRLSEHAHANAVDVSGFVLEDGRRITVANDWTAGGDGAAFLRAVRGSACQRFVTILSPDYNALHHDHLHFDMGGKSFCR
ncbi:MAG: extensin [Sphingomonadales bacterium]|nr:extensin [Sphingomonadales bacterium]